MCSNNGTFKPVNIDWPLPIGTHVTYLNAESEVRHATVVQAGYYVLVVYNDDHSISIIRYLDLVAVG